MKEKEMNAVRQGESTSHPEATEVRPRRRRFSADYKRRILSEASACKHGELGLMLRREGLYNSTLDSWRRQQRTGTRESLDEKKRGPKAKSSRDENIRLQRDVARLQEKLRQAELIIEVQKKLCTILGLPADQGAA